MKRFIIDKGMDTKQTIEAANRIKAIEKLLIQEGIAVYER